MVSVFKSHQNNSKSADKLCFAWTPNQNVFEQNVFYLINIELALSARQLSIAGRKLSDEVMTEEKWKHLLERGLFNERCTSMLRTNYFG